MTPTPVDDAKRARNPIRWYSSLRTRLALLVLLGAVPVSVSIVLLVHQERKKDFDREREKLRYVTETITDDQRHRVELGIQIAKTLAADARLRQTADRRCGHLLAAALEDHPKELAGLLIVDRERRVLCSSTPHAQLLSLQETPALAAAWTRSEPVVGEMMAGASVQQPILPLFTVMRDADDHPAALLIVLLDQSWLKDALRDLPFSSRRVIGVTDTAGRVAFRNPDEGWSGRDVAKTGAFRVMVEQSFRGLAEGDGLDGVQRVYAFAPYGKTFGTSLVVWVSEPIDAVLAGVPHAASIAGLVAFGLLALLLVVLWWSGDRFILKPVAALVETSRRLGRGDLSARAHLEDSQSELGMLGAAFDAMAESLARMDEAVRANRALKVLLGVRGVYGEGESENSLFSAICRATVKSDGYALAWICLVHDDAEHTIGLGGEWGADPALIERACASNRSAFGIRLTETALNRGEISTIADLPTPDPTDPWHPIVDNLQLKSSISLPLVENGLVYGALVIFAKESGAFSEMEAGLLAETACDITAKREALRARREHRQAEEALAASEALLARAEEIGHGGSWSVDFAAHSLVGSDGFFRILETDRQSFANTPDALFAMMHPEDRDAARGRFQEAVRSGTQPAGAFRIITPRGNVRNIRLAGELTFDAAGQTLRAIGTMRDVTEELAVKAALADREAVYVAMVDQARDAIVLVDPRTRRFAEFNEAAHANLGYTREEFAQLTLRSLDAQLSDAEIHQSVEEMCKTEGGTLETRLRRRDGTLRDVRISARPIVRDGQTFLAAIWADVTATKATEATLRRVNREQRMLAAAHRAILYATDETGLLQTVCDAVVQVGGYLLAWVGRADKNDAKSVTPLAFSGDGAEYVAAMNVTWADEPHGRGPTGVAIRTLQPAVAQHMDSDPQYAPWSELAKKYGYSSTLSVPMLVNDGEETLCLATYSPLNGAFDADETLLLANLAKSVAFGVNALRVEQARRQAEAENRKLLLAVEQSPESIAITDLNAHIEYVNPAFERHTGYTAAELIGQNPRVLQSGHTSRETYDEMWASLMRGEAWHGEFINRRKDGSEYTEVANMAPIRQKDGKVTHYLAIKDDITERKRMSHELEKHRLHLEDLVVSRTAELAEAQQHAEAANLAKSAFLANMSHEIRTPMNAIIGLTHLLRETKPRPDQAERLRKIDRSAKHLLSIVNDILDLSKVEAGKLRVEQLEFSLGEVLSTVQENLNDRAVEKSLEFKIEKSADLPERLRGDPLRLSQILLNLGTNAVKFTMRGDITLRVQALATSDATLRVRFEMCDTGIGLAQEQISRLFQPFEQADVSTTRKYGGTGLGLAICGRLVDLMGGQIGVESQLGAGSTFWFELPFAPVRPRHRHDNSQASGLARAVRAGVPPSHVRLLLVEDDPINQEVATDLLRSKGFEVDVAENGAVGIERAETTHYDAILMDVQMPVMDGLTATRELRTRPSSATTPILAMTANAFAEDKAACQEAGMDDFVAKPIQPDALFATISRWTGALIPTRPQSIAAGPAPIAVDMGERLRRISGLNVAVGLNVVQGDWLAYERLLRRFCTDRAGAVAELRADVESGRWGDARRAAHTLKGLAATLGAEPLRRAAAALETALVEDQHGQETLSPLLDVLAGQLHSLVADLEVCLPAVAVAAAGPVNWPEVREAVRRLDALLADDDVHALETFRQHAPAFRAALGPVEADLRRAVEAFEFETALSLLRATVAGEDRLA